MLNQYMQTQNADGDTSSSSLNVDLLGNDGFCLRTDNSKYNAILKMVIHLYGICRNSATKTYNNIMPTNC